MTSWQWQDDNLWEYCVPEARARAAEWEKQRDVLYEKLALRMGEQPLTAIADDAAMLQQIMQHKDALAQHASTLVVVGTGGASLGAQALCALSANPSRVRFLENCDPTTLNALLRLPCDDTAWLIISKSGETVETLAAALSLITHYGDDAAFAARVRVVTANPQSPLGTLAAAQAWRILEHPATLGGRFSVFSIVGLLPAAFAGLDIAHIATAAKTSMQHSLQHRDEQLLRHACWIAANIEAKPMQVLMAYADRLRPATQWFKQLWAESLGKMGYGQTPLTAIGSIDQHSQLQLYLDGPRDKLITLWLPEMAGEGVRLATVDVPGLAYLGGHAMGDVMHATAEATATTLSKAHVPLRVARGVLTPVSLAQWFARQMLETLLVAILIQVDPYSQPAVEEGKKLTRAALAARV